MRCRLALALFLLVLLPAAVPAVQAKSLDGLQQGTQSWIESEAIAGAGSLAALFAEAGAANGHDPAAWPAASPLAPQVAVPPEGAAAIQLLRPLRALALAHDSRATPEGNLTQRVLATFDGAQFGAPQAVNDDAYAILALRAAGVPVQDDRLQASGAFLQQARNPDGGWGWAVGGASGTDMTGLVLDALAALDRLDPSVAADAASFVASAKADRGYAESPGGNANCESTAWALRILARHEAGTDADGWRFLLSLQQPDGGVAHLPGGPSDAFCTSEVLTLAGLAGAGTVPFPLESRNSTPGPSSASLLFALATIAVAMSTRIRSA